MKIVKVAAASIVILLLATGCPAPHEGRYAKVCDDTSGNIRAADDKCDKVSTSQRYRWRYYLPGITIPAVGKHLPSGGSYEEPEDTKELVRIPPSGGTANEAAD